MTKIMYKPELLLVNDYIKSGINDLEDIVLASISHFADNVKKNEDIVAELMKISQDWEAYVIHDVKTLWREKRRACL